MTKYWKKGLILFLALFMVFGMLPLTVFASVDKWTGMPKDVADDLVLSIYTPEGEFPGEPAVYGTEKYENFNHKFAVQKGAVFKSSAKDELNWEKIKADIVEGTRNGSTTVWGVYDAAGTKDYFLEDASIIQPANEAKIIRGIKTDVKNLSDEEVLKKYEVIWYVIKLQHTPGYSSWHGYREPVTEWHIDGVVKERAKISINYYGNGNTSGNAPLGVTDHTPGDPYTISGSNGMSKTDSTFLGWSAKADGTGAEIGFYQPGDVINPTENISLYAMWNTKAKYDATVYTYLDGELTDDSDIHGTVRELYLSKDGVEYIELVRIEEGVYFTKITGNGKFLLYNKNADGTYTQVSDQQLVIYNNKGSMEVHYYSVTYDANGGNFEADPGQQNYLVGESITAVNDVPTKSGFNFIGWQVNGGNVVDPGENVTSSIETPITLVAQWEKYYSVETIADPVNGGSTTGAGNYKAGEDVTVTAVASDGYRFDGWYDEDNVLLTENVEYSFTINADRTLTAKFELIKYTVATMASPAEGGETSGGGIYTAGSSVTVTAQNNPGYKFVGWYEGETEVSKDKSYNFTVNADRTLTAKFELIKYTVATIADPVDGGTTTGDGTYAAGTPVTVKAVASDDYRFDGWYENGVKVSVAEEYAFDVIGDHTLTAKFYLKPITTYTNDYAYIFGYNDSTMGAEGPLTRREAAVMVHRLAKQNNQRGDFNYAAVLNAPTFADVKPEEWCFSGIEYIAYRGGFNVQKGGNVQPYAHVTRGEVAKFIALGLGFTPDKTLSHMEYAQILCAYGYLKGDENGDLKLNDKMSRAEFCTLFNRIIGRENAALTDKDGNEVTAESYGFTDLDSTKWYYADMIRATSAYTDGYIDRAKRDERNVLDDYS